MNVINPNNFRITDTPRRASLYYSNQTEKIPPGMPKREARIKFRVAFFGILGMVIVYSIMTFWIFVVEPAVTNVSDQIHYGDSKVFMMGAGDIGHGGFSRFIAEDNNGDVIVVEVVNKRYFVYTVETLTDKKQRVVTLEVKDINGDGRKDLIVNIEGLSPVVLLNNGKAFSWDGK